MPPRLVVWLRFRCAEDTCTGHRMQIIDWELTALQHRSLSLSSTDLAARISEMFMRRMFLNDTDPIIFVGNQADVARRRSFTVLGVYYPKRNAETTPPLF